MNFSASSAIAPSALLQSIGRLRQQLATHQAEFASGKILDPGLSLGRGVQRLLSIKQQSNLLAAYADSNDVSATRLAATDVVLESLRANASRVRQSVIAARDAGNDATIAQQARNALASIISDLNTTVAGEHLFAGINTAAAPLSDYFKPSAPAKAAIDAAFSSAFGMSQTSPNLASITPGAMSAYLDGPFGDVFRDPQWGAVWSSASDRNIVIEPAPGQRLTVSTNANSASVRKLAMAVTMLADSGVEALNPATKQVLYDKTIHLASEALVEFVATQARMGDAKAQIDIASQHIASLRATLEAAADKTEAIDPYAVATRINDLQIQLETAYSLTSRLRQLSLVKYL